MMQANLKFERNNKDIHSFEPSVFPRGDTIKIVGVVHGEGLTGLAATLTAKMVVAGVAGATAFTKTSGVGGDITLDQKNSATHTVEILIESADTRGYGPGQEFVFDVEFTTTTTPPEVYTVIGRFSISEDYTLN